MASVRRLRKDDKNSPWIVEYTDASGRRRRKTPKSGLFKDADALRKKIEREIGDAEHTPDADTVTVKEVCALFMADAEMRFAREEIGKYRLKNYRTTLTGHVIPKLGARRFNELRVDDYERFSNDLVRGGLQPRTVRGYLKIVRLVEAFAIKRRFTRIGLVQDVQKGYRTVSMAKVRVPSKEEVRQIFVALDKPAPWKHQKRRWLLMRCLVLLEGVCGLRFGEAVALKTDDLDFARNIIHVRNSLTYWDDLKGPKTENGIRVVPMPSAIVAPLKEWLVTCYVPNERGLIFRSKSGGPVAHCSVWATWQKLLEHAGVERCRPHSLRHFAASMMIDRGLPPADVAKLLGHGSFDITLRVYTHSLGSAQRNHLAIEGLASDLLSAPSAPERDENATSRTKSLILQP